uniref:PAS domain-containing protein n=1 Tax=Globisporangium ultimum (strain ATCC 200006 / CBS 805.95 / DAOM BR144) TaxID=431595 RepID=K3WGM8_GLOUD
MNLGSVTLLELNEVPDGKRIAYCLPSGEFIFATSDSARCFGSAAEWSAEDLYGKNLCPFLAAHDVEKLEDYMRAQCSQFGVSAQYSSELQMMVRVLGTDTPIWIRLRTIPLTLRLSRCIDAVRCIVNPVHLFADSSSFVISEEDLSLVFVTSGTGTDFNSKTAPITPASLSSPTPFFDACMLTEEDVLGNDKPPVDGKSVLPLELKDTMTATYTSPKSRYHDDAKRALSPTTQPLEPSGEDASMEDQSLASYAFEADWASEVLHSSLKRSSTDTKLRAALVT